MGLIENFPSGIVTNESIEITILPPQTKEFYRNVIKYLDEHIYFNYLKATDANYGMNFHTQLPYYLRQDVGVDFAKVIYDRRYPDHEEYDSLLLSMIRMELEDL